MKKLMKTAICLFCIILFSGCVSLKQTKQTGIKKIDNTSAFNGVYENNFAENDTEFFTLWSQLKLDNTSEQLDFKQAKIELTALSKTRIKAIWRQGNEQKAELVLKGKLKDNYFVSKHKRTIIPIPLIYGEFKNNQFQLALSENNNLLIDRLDNQWGWVFFFLAANNSTKSYEYKGIKF